MEDGDWILDVSRRVLGDRVEKKRPRVVYSQEELDLTRKALRAEAETARAAIQRYLEGASKLASKYIDLVEQAEQIQTSFERPDHLPSEIWAMIAMQLDPPSYLSLMHTNRAIHALLSGRWALTEYYRVHVARWGVHQPKMRAAIDALYEPAHVFTPAMILLHLAATWVMRGALTPTGGAMRKPFDGVQAEDGLPREGDRGAVAATPWRVYYASGLVQKFPTNTHLEQCLFERVLWARGRKIMDLTDGHVWDLELVPRTEMPEKREYPLNEGREGNFFVGRSWMPGIHIVYSDNVPSAAPTRAVENYHFRYHVAEDKRIYRATTKGFRCVEDNSLKQHTFSAFALKAGRPYFNPKKKEHTWTEHAMYALPNTRYTSWRNFVLLACGKMRLFLPGGSVLCDFNGGGAGWTLSDIGPVSNGPCFFFFTFKRNKGVQG